MWPGYRDITAELCLVESDLGLTHTHKAVSVVNIFGNIVKYFIYSSIFRVKVVLAGVKYADVYPQSTYTPNACG